MYLFRLLEAVPKREFEQLTGLSVKTVEKPINWALAKGYVTETNDAWQISEQGKLFLNELLAEFLPE